MHCNRAFATATILILIGFSGCGGRPERGRTEESGGAGGMPWTVRIGSQGGFTGGGGGYVVHADGSVESWSRITPQDPIETEALGDASPDRLAALQRALMDPQLAALTYEKSGNLTGFLEWSDANGVRRYSWPERVGVPDLPAALRVAVEAARAAVQSARP